MSGRQQTAPRPQSYIKLIDHTIFFVNELSPAGAGLGLMGVISPGLRALALHPGLDAGRLLRRLEDYCRSPVQILMADALGYSLPPLTWLKEYALIPSVLIQQFTTSSCGTIARVFQDSLHGDQHTQVVSIMICHQQRFT